MLVVENQYKRRSRSRTFAFSWSFFRRAASLGVSGITPPRPTAPLPWHQDSGQSQGHAVRSEPSAPTLPAECKKGVSQGPELAAIDLHPPPVTVYESVFRSWGHDDTTITMSQHLFGIIFPVQTFHRLRISRVLSPALALIRPPLRVTLLARADNVQDHQGHAPNV